MSDNNFNKINDTLNDLQRNADDLSNGINVSFAELFPCTFMQKHTQFSSIDELVSAGGFKVESKEDFESIPDDEFNKHIASTTQFESWDDMINEAASQYAFKKLRL